MEIEAKVDSAIVEKKPVNWSAVESALVKNDYSKLSPEERMALLNKTCESMGLNPLGQPFGFFNLQGKEVLYAKRNCTDQLSKLYGLSIIEADENYNKETGIFTVRVKMQDRDGRISINRGDVFIPKALAGVDLANAFMKAHTKAIRRTTLAMCGLGFLDETEVSDIPNYSAQTTVKFASKADKAALFARFSEVAKNVENLKEMMKNKFPELDSATMTAYDIKEVSDWLNTVQQ